MLKPFQFLTSYQQSHENDIREDRGEVYDFADGLDAAYQAEEADHPGQSEASKELPSYVTEVLPRGAAYTENVVTGRDRQLHALQTRAREFFLLRHNAEQRRKVRYRSSDMVQR